MNTVGILFRTYATNRVGSETMGLLQLVLSVYYPACTLASSGVYVASTRLCSQALARKDRSIPQILNRCLIYALAFGGGAFLLLRIGAHAIAVHWLQFPGAETPLKILAFGLPFLAAANSLQGFFLSLRKATYSTVLQITEDLSKIGATVLLFSLFLDRGPNAALCAMVAGMAVGETASCLFGYFLYLKKLPTLPRGECSEKSSFADVVKIALPCAFSAYLRSGIGMLESMLVPRGLQASGMTEEQTLAALGRLEGMALPVLLFPAAFLTVVSKLLVPEITAENAIGHKKNNIETINSILRKTLTYGVFLAAFAALFGEELGYLLYKDRTCGKYISCLAPMIPILYCDRVTDGIMKGYNKQLDSMKINLAETVLRTAGTRFLLPYTGVTGYISLFCASATFNFFLSFRALKKECGIPFPVAKGILLPLTASLAAMLPLKILHTLGGIPLWICAAGAIPLFLIFLWGCSDRKRGSVIPPTPQGHGDIPKTDGRRSSSRRRRGLRK